VTLITLITLPDILIHEAAIPYNKTWISTSHKPAMGLLSPAIAIILVLALNGIAQAGASVAAATAEAQSPGATAGAAVCSLNIRGFGSRAGIKSASLSCTGGSVKARIHELFQDTWKPSTLKGVTTSGFDAEAAGCVPVDGCLITICGKSNAVFQAPAVTSLTSNDDMMKLTALLCISGGSTITIRQGTFSSNDNTPVAIYDTATSVLLDKCTFKENDVSVRGDANLSGGIFLQKATVRVQFSTLSGNVASGNDGSTITAITEARLSIIGSRFVSNKATYGGAILAMEQGHAVIQDSLFESNEAFNNGGAIYLKNGSLEVLPSMAGSGESSMQLCLRATLTKE